MYRPLNELCVIGMDNELSLIKLNVMEESQSKLIVVHICTEYYYMGTGSKFCHTIPIFDTFRLRADYSVNRSQMDI